MFLLLPLRECPTESAGTSPIKRKKEQKDRPFVWAGTTPTAVRSAKSARRRLMKSSVAGAVLSLALAVPAFAQDVVVVPDPVTTWVTEQPLDDDVVVEKDVVVGDALPDKIVVKNVKDHDDFGYAVVNKKRVIIQPSTRKVVKIID
jgi:hypothetical protein